MSWPTGILWSEVKAYLYQCHLCKNIDRNLSLSASTDTFIWHHIILVFLCHYFLHCHVVFQYPHRNSVLHPIACYWNPVSDITVIFYFFLTVSKACSETINIFGYGILSTFLPSINSHYKRSSCSCFSLLLLSSQLSFRVFNIL